MFDRKDRKRVLGVGVDMMKKGEVMARIEQWIKGRYRLHLVVTAYSEFFVIAKRDREFRRVMEKADMVVADGAGVLAAVRYDELNKGLGEKGAGRGLRLVGNGLKVGFDGLLGRNGEVVTGVWLFEEIIKRAGKSGDFSVFLLGGFGETAKRLSGLIRNKYPKIRLEWDRGEQRVGKSKIEERRVIRKINEFKPDVLLVAYGPVKQEKWIERNRRKLRTKVAIGLGGTFDEVLGEVRRSPEWMSRRGLKWLWRAILEPRRIGRIFRAVVVFPWLVFKETVKQSLEPCRKG